MHESLPDSAYPPTTSSTGARTGSRLMDSS